MPMHACIPLIHAYIPLIYEKKSAKDIAIADSYIIELYFEKYQYCYL
jgi:hypothetical protein